MKPEKFILTLAGGAALFFALSASKCETETTFPGYVTEICTDKIDNDEDGRVDCQDSDCAEACAVKVAILPPVAPLAGDTLTLTGTHLNASTISVTVTPSGLAGAVNALADGTWKAPLTSLTERTTYTVIAVAADAQGGLASDTVTLVRAD